MKKYFILFILVWIFIPSSAHSTGSTERNWFLVGFRYEGLLGRGVSDNRFKIGPGLSFELGRFYPPNNFGLAIGTGFYKTSNHVGQDHISATFYTPFYFTYRRYQTTFWKFDQFLCFGMSWNLMYLERMGRPENHLLVSCGIADQLCISNNRMLELMIKPYINIFSDLEQYFGVEFKVSYGLISNQTQHAKK